MQSITPGLIHNIVLLWSNFKWLIIKSKNVHKYRLLILCLVWLFGSIFSMPAQEQEAKNYVYYYNQGRQALEQLNYGAFLENLSKSNQLRPGHQIIMYQLARAFAYNQIEDSTLHYLTKALAIKADFDLADSAFLDWQQSPGFKRLKALQSELLEPVRHSEVVAIHPKRDLHIESLAYDSKTNRLFLGSVRDRKIIWQQLEDTTWHDFNKHKLGSVFGMRADPQRRHLWVCSVNTPYMLEADSTALEISTVYKFHLDTQELIKTYAADTSLPHWFGDLTLNGNGDVYISDSRANAIYRITTESDSLQLFLQSDEFLSLQGLDFDGTGEQLFVSDYVRGPFRVNLQNRTIAAVECQNAEVSLKSIDGLYYYENSLVATQNQVVPMRVAQYLLDESGTQVVSVNYLEKGNPLLNEPTLGFIHDGHFYYVANSQWGGYDEQNQPLPWEQLQEIHIMKVKL